MKIISLLLSGFFSLTLSGQYNMDFTYDWEMQYFKYSPIKYVPEVDVDQITFTYTSKKVVKTYTKKYENGKLSAYVEKNKADKTVKEAKLTYDESNELKEVEIHKRGKLKHTTTYVSNENGKPLSQKKVNGKGVVVSYDTWKYNDDDCLTEFIYHKRGGKKVGRRWSHEYRENCEKSKTYLYKGNGKLENTWTYDCKAEGEKLEKKKNLTQVCKWEELTPDVITKVYQSFDERGRTIKNVSKFTAGDTLLLEIAMYNKKDQLIYRTTYDKDVDKATRYEYYKNGKIQYATTYEYQDDKIISYSRIKKGKLIGTGTYAYNDEKLLTDFVYTGKKGVVYKEISLAYMK